MAISDFICYFLPKQAEKVEPKPTVSDVPPGYRPLFFHCWLCNGVTKFACKNSIKKKKFTIECSRCGIENVVSINVPQN